MKKTTAFFLCIVFISILVVAVPAFANHEEDVLGALTPSSDVVFPPVTAGAGYILPDSPLYFLDLLSQQVKLALAFSPDKKAKRRILIAGERLSEARIMFARNNKAATTTALSELSKETMLAAEDLSDAASQGYTVTALAREFNETIKQYRKTLAVVANQTQGALRVELLASRDVLKEAKVKVEEQLPQNEMVRETTDDLKEAVEDNIAESRNLSESLKRLQKTSSVAGISIMSSQSSTKK